MGQFKERYGVMRVDFRCVFGASNSMDKCADRGRGLLTEVY